MNAHQITVRMRPSNPPKIAPSSLNPITARKAKTANPVTLRIIVAFSQVSVDAPCAPVGEDTPPAPERFQSESYARRN